MIHIFSIFRAPHWSVRIGYIFIKIDSWGNAQGNLFVDSLLIDSSINSSTIGTSSICGYSVNDYSVPLNVNFTHTSDSMTIKINTTLNETAY